MLCSEHSSYATESGFKHASILYEWWTGALNLPPLCFIQTSPHWGLKDTCKHISCNISHLYITSWHFYAFLVCRAMAKHAGPRLPAIVECLCPSLNNIYECQRITVTAFFSEVVNTLLLIYALNVISLFIIKQNHLRLYRLLTIIGQQIMNVFFVCFFFISSCWTTMWWQS